MYSKTKIKTKPLKKTQDTNNTQQINKQKTKIKTTKNVFKKWTTNPKILKKNDSYKTKFLSVKSLVAII